MARLIRPGRIRDGLHGVWLGHPLHPVLVQCAAGAWLSASILDTAPDEQSAARLLTAAGLAAAAPAALVGAVDWSEQHEQQMRVGVVHAVGNAIAMGCYGCSLATGSSRAGRLLRLGGLAALGVSGLIGGHISFRLAGGANHAEAVPHIVEPGWHNVMPAADLPDGRAVRKMLGETPSRWLGPGGSCMPWPTGAVTCPGSCRTATWSTAASPARGTAASSGCQMGQWPAVRLPRRSRRSTRAWSTARSRYGCPAPADDRRRSTSEW